MGNTLNTILGERRRKRKTRDRNFLSECDDESDEMPTPKRRRLMTTSKYIYKALFEESQNSDITIVALGRDWRLHKVYLCQSSYFSSMFSGSWREAEEGIINVGIEDPNITVDALQTVFGSLYQDEITIIPGEVVPVLAAATLFQLDGVIQQCTEIMAETISLQTVLSYYEAAQQYGLKIVLKETEEWLQRNLLTKLQESSQHLRQIRCELMVQLLSSPQLIVIQTEFTLYILLKCWVFLLENPSWNGDDKDCILESHKYFQSLSGGNFLESASGRPYLPAFRALRLQHLVNHHLDMEMLETDHIVPIEWFLPIIKTQWYLMLRVDQGIDRGPKQISDEEFDKMCLRCGRVLTSEGQHVWRWTGFNFGLDIVVTYSSKSIRFRRNQRLDPDVYGASSQHCRRNLMYRLTVYYQDGCGQLLHSSSTGLNTLTLGKNEEVKVLSLESQMSFPLVVSANFLVTTPVQSLNKTRPSAVSGLINSEGISGH